MTLQNWDRMNASAKVQSDFWSHLLLESLRRNERALA